MTLSLSPLVAFIVGACFGSFLNVCIARWPRERSVIKPRSRCPHCGNQLRWFENIPIVSWLALRGRCRCCDEPISVQYPIVELTVAIGWLMAFTYFASGLDALRVAVFATTMFGVAITDAKHYVIPDGFTVFGLFWVLVTAVIAFFARDTSPFAGPYDALVGACAGAGMIAIVGWLGEVATKREAMGLGDVTLMAVIGAAVGPQRALITVFIAAALGAIAFLGVVYPIAYARRGSTVGREQTELALGGHGAPVQAPLVPFGVFLAPAAMVTLLWGHTLLEWLLGA